MQNVKFPEFNLGKLAGDGMRGGPRFPRVRIPTTSKMPCSFEQGAGAGDGMRTHSAPSAGSKPDKNKFAPTYVGALERETGFEPAISALARQRSTSEPLPHIKFLVRIKGLEPPRRRH